MSMSYIRKIYGVPAKRGGRIEFSGNIGKEPMLGTIVGSYNGRINVQFDERCNTFNLHPTWEIKYLEPVKKTKENL